MNKKWIALSIGAILLIPTSSAFAKLNTSGAEHGSINMDQEISNAKAGIVTVKPLVAENAGGGWWDHGEVPGYLSHYSNYNHTSKTHNASSGNSSATNTSQWMGALEGMAYSSIKDSLWGNTANWNTK